MKKNRTIKIGEVDVRVDLETGFICLTDLASLRGNSTDNLKNWMRNAQSINFFEAWEQEHTPENKNLNLDQFRLSISRDVAYVLSGAKLVNIGCAGIFVQRGRYGGTYCHIDWATHFANWFDARFYVLTIKVARELSDRVYGREASQLRFSRDLAAKNYNLLTQANDEREIPRIPDPRTRNVVSGDQEAPVRRHLKQVDADILNVALWGMTAKQWRSKHQPDDPRANMRDFATTEELHTVASLQVILRHFQEDQYTRKEMLARLTIKAREFIKFYCDTPEKEDTLELAREKRGW